ncbi:hypothetical protein R5R35_011709 [Gryllus longicercus]|uniref:Uncharacterized protein n=1 Tax=Gryllus longicercus TaxID=2509291 RepID=A0AAN9YXU6_9ORTH
MACGSDEARGERRGLGGGTPARDPARGRGSRAGAGVGGVPSGDRPDAAGATAAVAVLQINRASASERPQRRRASSAMAHTRTPARF